MVAEHCVELEHAKPETVPPCAKRSATTKEAVLIAREKTIESGMELADVTLPTAELSVTVGPAGKVAFVMRKKRKPPFWPRAPAIRMSSGGALVKAPPIAEVCVPKGQPVLSSAHTP
jgi:hypothetical protein